MKTNERAGPADPGTTRTAQGEQQQPKPRQPHEHDESASSQAPDNAAATSMGRIAHDSVASGQKDTDKGPVLDATYEKEFRK